MLNITEGSVKFSNKDRKNFYTTARGSVFECASLVRFLCDEQEIANEFKGELIRSYEDLGI